MVQQSLRYRGLDGDFSLAEVCLVRAHDGVGHARLGSEVNHLHLRQQLHRIGSETALVHYLRVGNGVLELVYLVSQV